ncbi:hypothetical protein KR032_011171, partial [Drosophila birchii]
SPPDEIITCDMCGKSSGASGDDVAMFGEWMRRKKLTVHYFCVLLATNLPQRGEDGSGIMGFLMRDIRIEVAAARKRMCCYCQDPGATIKCNNCEKYFHLVCTIPNCCTVQFHGQFHSYCDECTPMDEYMKQLADHPPKNITCDICLEKILSFAPHLIVFPECCRLGFAHKMCMRRYALSSGYALLCIWCRSSKFRDSIRMQGIYVPDRDAKWETQRNAYRELHTRTVRCDEKDCLCSHGRTYSKATWYIYSCQVCGSNGAHARCLALSMQLPKIAEPIKFKCTICQEVEKKLADRALTNKKDQLSSSCVVVKEGPKLPSDDCTEGPKSPDDEKDSSTNASVVTVISNHRQTTESSIAASQVSGSPKESPLPAEAIDLSDSQPQPPPVKLLELRESFMCEGEPFFYLVIYEFDENERCKGSCTLRFDDQDPRVKDRSEESLRRVQIRPEDVYFRNKDCGVY